MNRAPKIRSMFSIRHSGHGLRRVRQKAFCVGFGPWGDAVLLNPSRRHPPTNRRRRSRKFSAKNGFQGIRPCCVDADLPFIFIEQSRTGCDRVKFTLHCGVYRRSVVAPRFGGFNRPPIPGKPLPPKITHSGSMSRTEAHPEK